MNRILTLAGAALISAKLTGCAPGINTLGNRITFDPNGMVVHAAGQPDARVGRDGNLSIGGNTVAVTPAQRQLLKRYYVEAIATMDSGEAMGKHGIAMAERGIGDAIASVFHRDSATADKRMDAESQKIETAATALCTDIKTLGATQKEIAAEIPEFAPYASGDQLRCEVTRPSRQRNGAASSSFTYALREDGTASATAIRVPSRGTSDAGASNIPRTSQP
jgi:hypothetical protein